MEPVHEPVVRFNKNLHLLEDLVGSISYPHLLAGENDTFPD